jgi:hypothetical protein
MNRFEKPVRTRSGAPEILMSHDTIPLAHAISRVIAAGSGS